LDRLELDQKPRLTVLNKADLLPDAAPKNFRGNDSVFLSAATGAGIRDLLTRISEIVVAKDYSPTVGEAVVAAAAIPVEGSVESELPV
jgi:50S ribosomal subunit-associated GTPase HflX